MPLFTKRVYDKSLPSDGTRLLIMRRWPRGIAKTNITAWDKGLAPSLELLGLFRTGLISWTEYVLRYKQEMSSRTDSIEALTVLCKRSLHETITLLCGCKDASYCHRTVLWELVNLEEMRTRCRERRVLL